MPSTEDGNNAADKTSVLVPLYYYPLTKETWRPLYDAYVHTPHPFTPAYLLPHLLKVTLMWPGMSDFIRMARILSRCDGS